MVYRAWLNYVLARSLCSKNLVPIYGYCWRTYTLHLLFCLPEGSCNPVIGFNQGTELRQWGGLYGGGSGQGPDRCIVSRATEVKPLQGTSLEPRIRGARGCYSGCDAENL
jgi:hypothetical protein